MTFKGLTLAGALAATAVSMVLTSNPSHAQTFPDRSIRLLVPYAAGGVTDQVGRQLAELAGKELGQTIVVENKPGANGTLGPSQLVGTTPDGYLLSMAPIGIFRLPHIQPTRFDPRTDFTYVSMLAGYSSAVGVNSDSPYKSLQDLVDAAKKPGVKLSYGTSGIYSSHHLAMIQLASETGAVWTHVPFKGDSEAITSMLGNNTEVTVVANTMVPFVQSGKIRILATFGDKRSADYPQAPTARELGFKVVQASPFGIVGPAGIPPDVVTKLDNAFAKAMQAPRFVEFAKQVGLNLQYQHSAGYTAYAKKAFDDEKALMTVAAQSEAGK
ncbi:MAG: tripartite tricarboxylate transporter substrate binding protein [Alcaligenaceae bacterium]|nr:MAG: tripartite tricarboxylate transporter substrate binding protein [Alcaligenaceae bacterium]